MLKSNLFRNALLAGIATGATVVALGVTNVASAQSITVGHSHGLDFGHIKAGHASGFAVGINGGNVTAKGGVADGLKIGSQSTMSTIQGAIEIPIKRGMPGIKLPFSPGKLPF